MKNIPIISYIQREWFPLLLTILAIMASLNDHIFQTVGIWIYIPALVGLSWIMATLALHLHFRETLDKYIHSGQLIEEWNSLEPHQRVRWTFLTIYVVVLFVAIIANGVSK